MADTIADEFAEWHFIADSYGLRTEFLGMYRFFRKQGLCRAHAAYYAALEWDL